MGLRPSHVRTITRLSRNLITKGADAQDVYLRYVAGGSYNVHTGAPITLGTPLTAGPYKAFVHDLRETLAQTVNPSAGGIDADFLAYLKSGAKFEFAVDLDLGAKRTPELLAVVEGKYSVFRPLMDPDDKIICGRDYMRTTLITYYVLAEFVGTEAIP